jgi:hypothetical protein
MNYPGLCSPGQLGSAQSQILQQQGQGFAQLQSVEGGIGEEESALRSSESSLDSSLASRAFSIFSCSVSLFSCSVSLLSRSDSLLDSIALSCASTVGCQFNFAKKRRHGGNEERNSDLLINLDAALGGDVDMAVGRKEGNQKDQGAGQQSSQSGSIQPREWFLLSKTNSFQHHHNEPAIEPIHQ